jgi:cytochrome c553
MKKMKTLKIALFSILCVGLLTSFAFAAGDAGKGKTLFSDTQLGGGTAGKSCNSCHPDGKGLDKAADRKDLPKVVNACIKNALKGKPIDSKSAEMADLVAYIKSLKAK